MYVGTQFSARSDDDYRVLAQLGVEHICGYPPGPAGQWTTERLTRYREHVESFGLTLDMVPLPLGSSGVSKDENPNIMLGKSPERDREIEGICDIIRACAAAGIPAVKYNFTILGHIRTSPRYGRGGAKLSSFRYAELDQSLPPSEGSPAPKDVVWERIDYLLDRIVPVAEEHRVRLACHPQDPGIGDRTYRGVARVLGTVEGLKRFVQMHESPYHGLNFCQGTVSEMLQNPGEQIYDVIRYFGSRNKIFNVHFRNIKGGLLDFVETFIDDGDVDMYRAMEVYREVGYPYMMMPDHVPQMAGDNARMVGFAYAYGSIKALIASVSRQS